MQRRMPIALLAVTWIAPCPCAASGSPADWLPTAGKSDAWRKAAARCRELLRRLDPDKPPAKRHLPSVRRGAELVRRTPSFDWKTHTAVEFLERMLEDLLAGREPHRRYAGRELAFPYWSEAMRRVEAIWLHVPPSYDPAKEYGLFLYYKCGGGVHYKDGKAHGGYRPSVEAANRTDAFHAWSSLSIQVKGRQGAVVELREAPAAIAREFSVSPDRVFLSGWSDGGFTAVWLASRHPHLVAGIAPVCANWQYGNVGDVALCGVAMLCVDGWGDGGYNAGQFRRWHALATMGADVAGLWGQHGHSYQPYEDPAELRRICDWARTRRRDPWPKRVRYATWNLSWHRAYWVSIERMVRPWLAARIDARVRDGNRVEVRCENVAAYQLTLSEKLLDPRRGVTVVTNGKESYAGAFRRALTVELVAPPRGAFVKSAAMPGGILAQIERSTYQAKPDGGLRMPGRRWLWVRSTGGDERTRKLMRNWAPPYAKDDTAVTDRDVAEANLFVLGPPAVNRFAARIADRLPVAFGKGSFRIGRRVYDQPTNCLKLIHPNPLNPRKYVILYAFNDAEAFAANAFFGTRTESPWGFRSGDCVVMGIPARPRKWGVARRQERFAKHHYVFGANWRPAAEEPLGELKAPLSYAQLLRLRADAAQEATGADAAVIGGYAPAWGLWGESLPAGPVTAHDLATVEMLPEYVCLGDVRGDELRRMVARAPASTVLADKRDPSYVQGKSLVLAEIDPAWTYRVAMGYRDLPAYGAEPKRMPPLHFFRTPEAFLASGHTSLPVRNLRITPIEMTAAVAEHIRRRKAVSPRATCFDLTQYLMDPRANQLGAFDWLHVGVDFAGTGPQEGTRRRYTLNVGLKPPGEPDPAPPRRNAKRFVDLGLAADGRRAIDLSTLDRKLPVTAEIRAEHFVITAPPKAMSYMLAGPGARHAIARCALVELRLANRGTKELDGVAALAPSAMRRAEGGTWPDKSLRRPIGAYYVGFRDTIGPRRKPPVHQTAALLLFDKPGAKLTALVAKRAGYNFGLVGIRRPVRIAPGRRAFVPLLLVEVPRGGIDLAGMLDALKGEIARKTGYWRETSSAVIERAGKV